MTIQKKGVSILFVLMMLIVPACGPQKFQKKTELKSEHVYKNETTGQVGIPLQSESEETVAIENTSLDDLFVDNDDNQVVAFGDIIIENQNFDWTDIDEDNKSGLTSILFDFDRNEIRPDQRKAVEENASIIKLKLAEIEQSGHKAEIIVEGHTCEIGTEKHNKVLSLNRAKTVQKELVNLGLDAKDITFVGRGSAAPVIVDGKPLMSKNLVGNKRDVLAPNRRVELRIISI